jgi:hypothetical protein
VKAVEFTAELNGSSVLAIPQEVARQLPAAGRASVIVLTNDDTDDADWRRAAYGQFLRDDPPEDAAYGALR